jgi:hypothetical protein
MRLCSILTGLILSSSALMLAMFALPTSSLSAQEETAAVSESASKTESPPPESPWSISGSIGHSSSLVWTSATGLSYGSATGLSLNAIYRDGGFSGRFSAGAELLAGSRSRELWLSATVASPGFLIIPGFTAGALPEGGSPDSLVVLRLDELSIEYGSGSLRLAGGRMAVNFGQGRAFSPADIFARFDRSGLMPRRQGVDIVELSAFPLPLADIRIVAKPSSLSFGAGSYAARVYSFLLDSDASSFSAAAGASWSGAEKSWILAPEARLDLDFASIYGEAAWRIPASAEAPSADSGYAPTLPVNTMIGLDTSVAGATLIAEYGCYGMESNPHRAFASVSGRLGEFGACVASATWMPQASLFTAGLALTIQDLAGAELSAGIYATGIPGKAFPWFSGWSPALIVSLVREF